MAIRVCVLGSGSRGNCTLVQTEKTHLLIDAARLGLKYIQANLETLGVSISDIDGIIATHVHGDHVDAGTTARLCEKFDIPLYVHHDTYPDLLRRSAKFEALEQAGLVRRFHCSPFAIGELTVSPFPVNHGGEFGSDVVGRPVGFSLLHHDGEEVRKIGFATDLGHIDTHTEEALLRSDVIVLECNHDVEAERKSSRPGFLKQWVMGPKGHLSNDQCGEALRRIISRSGRSTHVILAHLSGECNTPELALGTVRRHLSMVGAADIPLHVALQHEKSEIVQI